MRALCAASAMITVLSFFMHAEAWADPAYEKAIDAVLAFPWTNGPSSLPDSAGWKTEQYSEHAYYEDPGYYSRAFVKETGPVRVKMFSYAEPSLTDSHETILMGYAQAAVGTEEEAKTIHGEMAGYLKNLGFEALPPDTTRLAIFLKRVYREGISFRKGTLDGRIYYIKDNRTEHWYVRTAISHPPFREFEKKWLFEWPQWWNRQYILPEKLTSELETLNVSGMLSQEDWNIIRNVSSPDSVY